jgi:hypothetical protein
MPFAKIQENLKKKNMNGTIYNINQINFIFIS